MEIFQLLGRTPVSHILLIIFKRKSLVSDGSWRNIEYKMASSPGDVSSVEDNALCNSSRENWALYSSSELDVKFTAICEFLIRWNSSE